MDNTETTRHFTLDKIWQNEKESSEKNKHTEQPGEFEGKGTKETSKEALKRKIEDYLEIDNANLARLNILIKDLAEQARAQNVHKTIKKTTIALQDITGCITRGRKTFADVLRSLVEREVEEEGEGQEGESGITNQRKDARTKREEKGTQTCQEEKRESMEEQKGNENEEGTQGRGSKLGDNERRGIGKGKDGGKRRMSSDTSPDIAVVKKKCRDEKEGSGTEQQGIGKDYGEDKDEGGEGRKCI